MVVVPQAGVIFAGDLFEESAPPAYGDDSYPLSWPATADALAREWEHRSSSPAMATSCRSTPRDEQAKEIAIVATLIRELHAAGIPANDALHEARDRWPFPPEALAEAVRRGYESLPA